MSRAGCPGHGRFAEESASCMQTNVVVYGCGYTEVATGEMAGKVTCVT